MKERRWLTFEVFSLLFLFGLTLSLYLPGINSYFIGESWDVLEHVITHQDDLYRLCFSAVSSSGEFLGIRPLKFFIYYLSYKAFGLNPLPLHLLILFLHISCAILTFYIISRFTEDKLVGLVVAVLFSAHWLNSEPVRWLEGQQEVLRSFFALVTIVTFQRYREGAGYFYYALALLALVLSLLSLESAVILPFVLLCIDTYYKGINIEVCPLLRGSPSGLKCFKVAQLYPHLPFILLTFCYIQILRSLPAIMNISSFNMNTLLKGLDQHFIYSFTLPLVIDSVYLFRMGVLILVLGIFVYFTSCSKKERTRILFSFLCFSILVLPFCVRGGFAARYGYLPSIASLTILALLVRDGSRKLLQVVGWKSEVVGKGAYTLCVIFCLVFLFLDWRFVSKNLKYYNDLGIISQSFIKATKDAFPEGIKNYTVICVNFPRKIDPGYGCSFGLTKVLIFETLDNPFAVLFGRQNLGTIMTVNASIESNLKYDPLYYTDIQVNSPEDYDRLACGPRKKVFFFHPGKKSIIEVTGQPYNEIYNMVKESLK